MAGSMQIGAIHVDLGLETGKFQKGVQGAKKEAAGLGASLKSSLGGAARSFSGGLVASLAGVGAGFAAALAPMALFQSALQAINDASRLVDVADKIGLSTTALQELSFGFSQAGVEQAEFETGMEQFSKRIGEAATKGGRLADILKANGIAIKDSNGQIKSSESLLASYADLVRNAASEQEKMVLVTEAFGRGGAAFLNALNDGSAGILGMKKAAQDAGGVIDEQLLRRSEELGDRWEAAWRRFSLNAQSAILTAVNGMDGLLDKLADYEKRKAAADLGTLAGSLVGKPGDVLTSGKSDKPNALDARMSGTLATELSAADQKLVDALQARYGQAAQKATIIPPSGEGSGGGNKAVREKLDLAERVIENLERERSLIGLSGVELEKQNALWAAGKDATAAQRSEIEALVTSIYSANEAWQAQQDALDEARDAARDFTGTLVNGLLEGKDASDVLSNALRQLGSRLLSSGLDGLFGMGGGGGALLGGLFTLKGGAA